MSNTRAEAAADPRALAFLANIVGDGSLDAAREQDRTRVLSILHAVAMAIDEASSARPPGGWRASTRLPALLDEVETRRHLLSLLREAEGSSDERTAMLCTVFLVAEQQAMTTRPREKHAALRERLERTARSLLPEDVHALTRVVDLRRVDATLPIRVAKSSEESWTLRIDLTVYPDLYDAAYLQRVIDGTDEEVVDLSQSRSLSPHALRALVAAECVELSTHFYSEYAGRPLKSQLTVEVLPLGSRLDKVLRAIDWRAVAAQTGSADPGG